MKLSLYLQLTTRDPQGKIVRRTRKRLAHSFVQQWLQGVRCLFTGTQETSVNDYLNVSNTLRDPDLSGVTYPNCFPTANQAFYGIIIGTGDAAVTMTDYWLDTQITHGAGAGELQFAAQIIAAFQQSGADAWFVMTRVFTNASGGEITLKETGIAYFWKDAGNNSKFWLAVRDVLASPVAVADGQSVTVDYTIKLTV